MPLAPDDPAREKIAELKAQGATEGEIMRALDTYDVSASYLVKALSPGHAKVLVEELMQHMIVVHLAEGTFAVTSVKVTDKPIDWIDGPLSGGELNG